MKFEKKDARVFGWRGLKGWAYNSKEDFPTASAAYIEVTGKHGKIKTTKSDKIYFIISGKGKFIINGKETQVKKTDVVIIPKNTPYDYSGKMKLFLVDTPAFDPECEVKLE